MTPGLSFCWLLLNHGLLCVGVVLTFVVIIATQRIEPPYQQEDLHEIWIESFQCAFSWTRVVGFYDTCVSCLPNVGICAASHTAPSDTFAGHRGFQRNFQFFGRMFSGVPEFHVIQIDFDIFFSIFEHCPASASHWPNAVFLPVQRLPTYQTKLLATSSRAWKLLEFL